MKVYIIGSKSFARLLNLCWLLIFSNKIVVIAPYLSLKDHEEVDNRPKIDKQVKNKVVFFSFFFRAVHYLSKLPTQPVLTVVEYQRGTG